MRRPPVVLGMAVITALALVLAVVLIVFQVNPQQDATQRGVDRQQRELAEQVREINMIICSQAQTTANAYRFRSLTPSGDIEPISHFLTRMQAQRQTLRLSRGRNCAVAPGFPPFELQLERALREINGILSHFDAEQREPISQDLEAKSDNLQGSPNDIQVSPEFGYPSFVPPPHAGVGEEGVPYVPKKPKAPKESAPSSPEAMPANERRDKVVPQETAASEEAPQGKGGPESQLPPASAEVKPPLKEVIEGVEGALGNGVEGLCTAIREVNGLC